MGSGGIFGSVGKVFFGDGGAQATADASNAAVAASTAASDKALALQERMYNETKATLEPYSQLALSAITQAFGGVDANGKYYFDPSKLNQYTTDKPFEYKEFQGTKFDPSKIDVTQDPSYQFRLNQGINALDKSAASKGMLLSGAQQKAINNYAQDAASQEYSNVYQRGLQTQNQQYAQDLSAYQQNMNNALTSYNSDVALGNQRYNQISNALGMGQTANNSLNAANANYSNQYTGTQMQNAGNLASAYAYGANGQASANRWLSNTSYNAFNDQLQNGMQMGGTMSGKMSDRRLKKNIVKVGTLDNGLNVYDFDYIWGGARERGVMAQEVLNIIPEAVIVTDSGYYAVDYSKIGVL